VSWSSLLGMLANVTCQRNEAPDSGDTIRISHSIGVTQHSIGVKYRGQVFILGVLEFGRRVGRGVGLAMQH